MIGKMKPLDDVIKAHELCLPRGIHCRECPYNDEDCTIGRKRDALHYLRQLQLFRQTPLMQGIHKAEKEYALYHVEDWGEENPPLTWDELKQMEGKPVWVEILSDEIDLSSRWMMVAKETEAHSLPLAYTDHMGHWIYGHEDDLGKTWNAYRREKDATIQRTES